MNKQEQELEDLIDSVLLDRITLGSTALEFDPTIIVEVINWVANNRAPADVFGEYDLVQWSLQHGFKIDPNY